MNRDIRQTAAFQEAEHILRHAFRPGEGAISGIADLQRSWDASHLLFTGTLVDELNKPGATRICAFDQFTQTIRLLTSGPNSDHHARTSPDKNTIAFLSDRSRAGDFQVHYLCPQTHTITAGPVVEGWIEYLAWSPDGRRLLLGVADHGAELSSGEGAYATGRGSAAEPDWMPKVLGAASSKAGRRVWVLEVATGDLTRVSSGTDNIWEASWCGNDRLAVVHSDSPEEGAWYAAKLSVLDIASGAAKHIRDPAHQIALPQASPSGKLLAFIEGVASDRGFVAGELRLHDLASGHMRLLQTNAVDITCIEWRTESCILLAGHRGLETVVLRLNVGTGEVTELWSSCLATASGDFATVTGLADADDFAFAHETFFGPPQIATMLGGTLRTAQRGPQPRDHCDAEPVRWQAPDGLPIEGWLLRPRSEPPYPTILYVHDGPVFHWRPHWLARTPALVMLLRRGYALFLPNPRGSSGRGQAFATRILGDVGGADTQDFLSGIDHLVAAGLADPARLGVTGLSYGGLMACWLPTQDPRFKAAISIGPATNHVSHHLTCNIPQFVRLFLQDHYTNLAGAYYARSPVLHAHKCITPTMLVCGSLDRCTPPGEALQFHNALLENGIETVVVEYPLEGHGVRGLPAAIDFAARCVMWFERHLVAVYSVEPFPVQRETLP